MAEEHGYCKHPGCGSPLVRAPWNLTCDVLYCDNGICPKYRNSIPILLQKPRTLIEDLTAMFTEPKSGKKRHSRKADLTELPENLRDYTEDITTLRQKIGRMAGGQNG